MFLGVEDPTEDDLTDCIGSLRRCLTQRNRFFEESYNLRETLEIGNRKHYLELLADLNVVRPTLLKDLLNVRNEIEYNDASPPGIEESKRMTDIVWYFLRSTDPLLKTQRTHIELRKLDDQGEETPYFSTLYIDYSPEFEAKLSGWVTPDLISDTEVADHVAIETEIFHTREGHWGSENHLDKNPDDIWLVGQLAPSTDQRFIIANVALGTA